MRMTIKLVFYAETSNCENGSMRLVPETPPTDGREPQEGRLEICYQGIWGSVYDTDWSGLDAAVTCQSLGFSAIGEYRASLELHT